MRTFSITVNQFKQRLAPFEKHLKLRNFLVGYSLTLADVTLVVNLIIPLQTVIDQQTRKDSLPNLTRYCQLILDSRSFEETFGRVHFAKKMLQPVFKKEEKPAAPAKKEAPLKNAVSTASQSTVASAKEEKQSNWEDLLPPIAESFNLFEFKTLIVNHADKREAL